MKTSSRNANPRADAGTSRRDDAASPGGGVRSRLSSRLRGDAAAVAVLLLLLVLAFSPWWAAGRLIAPLDILDAFYAPWNADAGRIDVHNHFTSDAVTQYLVYRKTAERSFAEDGRICWSDLTGGGRPEHANTMALYGDWTMQLHRFLDYWTAWHLGLMGQFLVAALGMFMFLRARGISPPVALVGAVAYGANTQFVLWIFHRWQLGAFAWVPWMVWAMDRDAAGRRWAWSLVPVFMALAFLGGNLQTAAFVALVVAAAALDRLMQAPAEARPRLAVAGRLLAWSALGTGLAAFTLLPASYAFLETLEIGMDRGGIGYANGLMQPILSLLFIPAQLFPSLLGSPGSMDLAKVLKLDLFDIAFFGFLPTVVACRVLFLRGTPRTARWLMALGLLLPLTPLVGPLYHRVQLLFIFGGVWAFAWYFEHADGEGVDPAVRRIFFVFAGLVALWLAGSITSIIFERPLTARIEAYVAERVAAGRAGALGIYDEWLLERARRLLPELRIWNPRQLAALAAALAGFGAIWLRARRGVGPAALLMLAAVVLELGVFTAGWVTAVDPGRHPPYPETPDIAAVREHVGHGRVYLVQREGAAPLFLPANTLAMYGIATLQEYETVAFHGMWEAAGFATDAASLGRLGVTHALSRPGRELGEGWTVAYRGDALVLWRNRRALPRYLALSAGGDWPPRTGSALNDSLAVVPTAGPGTVVSATMNRRVLDVPPGTAAVRVAENWSDGWRFRVDGGPWQPVGKAADRSMLIPLEPAPSAARVEMDYRPRRRIIGGWIALAALAVVAAGGWVAFRRPIQALPQRPPDGSAGTPIGLPLLMP